MLVKSKTFLLLATVALSVGQLGAATGNNCQYSEEAKTKFKPEFLDIVCGRKKEWNQKQMEGIGMELSDVLKPEELEYFNTVTNCRNMSCLSELIATAIEKGLRSVPKNIPGLNGNIPGLNGNIPGLNGNIPGLPTKTEPADGKGTPSGAANSENKDGGLTSGIPGISGKGEGGDNQEAARNPPKQEPTETPAGRKGNNESPGKPDHSPEKNKGNSGRRPENEIGGRKEEGKEEGEQGERNEQSKDGRIEGEKEGNNGRHLGNDKGKGKRSVLIGEYQNQKQLEMCSNQSLKQNRRFVRLRKRRQQKNTIQQKAIRKEYRLLSDKQRREFHDTLNELKNNKVQGFSRYDILIAYHTAKMSPGAHFGAAFMPFHREWLRSIEFAMRTQNPDVSIPYWDSSMDQPLPNPADSVIWSDDFMGPSNGEVNSGPFSSWRAKENREFELSTGNRPIIRAAGKHPAGFLYKAADTEEIINTFGGYNDFVFCKRELFEFDHGGVHLWIGGHMLELEISPNDPIFLVHHSFVDFLWEQWRQSHQTREQRVSDYPNTDTDACSTFHAAQTTMKPFGIKNIDGLSNHYTDELYDFEPRPTCPSCGGSKYLFCHTSLGRCVSKVRANGNCVGLEGFNSCYRGRCTGGVCVPTGEPVEEETEPPPQPSPTTPDPGASSLTLPPKNDFGPFGSATPIGLTLSIVINSQTQPVTQPTRPQTHAPPNPTIPTPPDELATTKSTKPFIPAPTPGATQTPAPNGMDTVWTAVTVLQKQGQGLFPVRNPVIRTVDEETGTELYGFAVFSDIYPSYRGAAYAQALNPAFAQSRHVEATISISTSSGQPCVPMCFQGPNPKGPGNAYNKTCDPRIILDESGAQSNVLYTQSKEHLVMLVYDGPHRRPTQFLFVCRAESNSDPDPDVAAAIPRQDIGIPPAAPAVQISTGLVAETTEDGCINTHRCCPVWSAVGECQRNFKWMQSSCSRSCKACVSENKGCQDLTPECNQWAREGQCNDNPTWMEENCQSSCGICQRSMSELEVLCGTPPDRDDCKNYNDFCKQWAEDGQCQTNTWWMNQNCPLACGQCSRSQLNA